MGPQLSSPKFFDISSFHAVQFTAHNSELFRAGLISVVVAEAVVTFFAAHAIFSQCSLETRLENSLNRQGKPSPG